MKTNHANNFHCNRWSQTSPNWWRNNRYSPQRRIYPGGGGPRCSVMVEAHKPLRQFCCHPSPQPPLTSRKRVWSFVWLVEAPVQWHIPPTVPKSCTDPPKAKRKTPPGEAKEAFGISFVESRIFTDSQLFQFCGGFFFWGGGGRIECSPGMIASSKSSLEKDTEVLRWNPCRF